MAWLLDAIHCGDAVTTGAACYMDIRVLPFIQSQYEAILFFFSVVTSPGFVFVCSGASMNFILPVLFKLSST